MDEGIRIQFTSDLLLLTFLEALTNCKVNQAIQCLYSDIYIVYMYSGKGSTAGKAEQILPQAVPKVPSYNYDILFKFATGFSSKGYVPSLSVDKYLEN